MLFALLRPPHSSKPTPHVHPCQKRAALWTIFLTALALQCLTTANHPAFCQQPTSKKTTKPTSKAALSAELIESAPKPDTGPTMQVTTDFIRSGTRKEGTEEAEDGKNELRHMHYDVFFIGNDQQSKDRLLSVLASYDWQDFCTFYDSYKVHLSDLDPESIDSGQNSSIVVHTTNGTSLVKFHESKVDFPMAHCTLHDPDQTVNSIQIEFSDDSYRDRAKKAMKHAIELAGGKSSAF